ncbi:MAG: hypothetical protein ACHQQS_17055 [Thermoanaerobaculales bacterium]
MSRLRIVTLSLFAVFAVSAVGATAAQAIKGPYYKVEGVRLKAGESNEIINATAVANFVLANATTGVKVTCTTINLNAAAKITGSSGFNNSGSVETITFGGCTVTGNGTGCTVEGGTVKTEPLVNNLAYAEKPPKKGTKILVVFEPESGAVFATIKFVGAGCAVPQLVVEPTNPRGGVCGGAAVKVGEEPAEANVGEINFPAAPIATAWVEAAGALAEVKCGLASGGTADTLTGLSSFELFGKPNWGIYTT